MRLNRLASIFLLAFYLAFGTGTLQHVHERQHAAEDAREDVLASAAGRPVESHHHDETNCDVHAQFQLAYFLTVWTPVSICLGLLLLFLILRSTPLISRRVPARIDCRGPPGFWSFPLPVL